MLEMFEGEAEIMQVCYCNCGCSCYCGNETPRSTVYSDAQGTLVRTAKNYELLRYD